MLQRYRMLVFATVVQRGSINRCGTDTQHQPLHGLPVSAEIAAMPSLPSVASPLWRYPPSAIRLADNNREFFGNFTQLRQLAIQTERYCHSTTHAPSNSGCRWIIN
ncbi:hypothetical protein [Shewanella sp.]|uniref:hypothetical protein n=1 Tax=Shewanella sp. TaxID=50422 RepID=UPI003D0BD57A